jgi:hypothetical protein
MPLYNSQPMQAVYPGDSANVFNAEAPLANQSSIALNLPVKDADQPPYISVELLFSAAPGVFEFDIQEADTDTDDAYITVPAVGQITTAQAGAVKSVARVDLVPLKAKFVRLKCVTPITNGGVTVIAKVSR